MPKMWNQPSRRTPSAARPQAGLRLGATRLAALLLSAWLIACCAAASGAPAASDVSADSTGLYAAIARDPDLSDPDKAAFVAQLMVRRAAGEAGAAAADAFTAVWTAEPELAAALDTGDLNRVLDRLQSAHTTADQAAAAAHEAKAELDAGSADSAVSALLAALPPAAVPAPPAAVAPRTLDASGALTWAQTNVEPDKTVVLPQGSRWSVHVAPNGNWLRVAGRINDQAHEITLPSCGPVYRLAGGVGVPLCGSVPAGEAKVAVHGFAVVTAAQLWTHLEVLTADAQYTGDAAGETTEFAADPS